MPEGRATNNSVSTLEEQTLLLRIMSEQADNSGKASSSSGSSEERKKSGRRKGPKTGAEAQAAKDVVTSSAGGQASVSNTVTVSHPQAPVTLTTAAPAGGVQAYPGAGPQQHGLPQMIGAGYGFAPTPQVFAQQYPFQCFPPMPFPTNQI